ncbi:MAG: DUF262 domain-containing protein [Ignavibacteriae bacterium]|nr:DUF262 domain-containing protein [Ignavibacteriota bacterium]
MDDTDKDYFLIPTYQRGYKWTSVNENSHVKVLMKDLYNAYQESSKRYYLQFITLKDLGKAFEVIDGQQRLTTLTILFALFHNFEEFSTEENFIVNKLNYQVRKNFIDEFIYNNIDELIASNDWDYFLSRNDQHNNQDVFYIFQATICINNFLLNLSSRNTLKNFYNYICNNVVLIVNVFDKKMNSEKLFVNVNKGIKLKDDDLIKGLLITKIPRDNEKVRYRLNEIEINEMRVTLGRQWDEISHWATCDDVRKYFNQNNEKDITWLLKLAFPKVNNLNSDISLFTYIFKLNKDGVQAKKIFEDIYKTKLILVDWYNSYEIYNLLGFLLHSRNSNTLFGIWKDLSDLKTKTSITKKLKELVKNIIPFDEDNNLLKEINYHDSKNNIFNLFLILDVAKSLPINGQEQTFYNFFRIDNEKWSIEHIFPQNAEELKNIDQLSREDLSLLKELLPSQIEDVELNVDDDNIIPAVSDLLNKIQSSVDKLNIDFSESNILKLLLSNNAKELHKIGNLALLESGMNSSLSNNYFETKRKKIVEKISMGHFVPSHTYDVFSKLIIGSRTSLHVWSKEDINLHEEYINFKISNLFQYLNS